MAGSQLDDFQVDELEIFDRQVAPKSRHPFVTIQAKGSIGINNTAYDLLGKPQAVELLYAPASRVLGLRPAPLTEPRAYVLREQSVGSWLVSGKAFTEHYAIDTTIARRYPAILKDGMLLVDLKQEGSVATGARFRRKDPAAPKV